VTKGTIQLHTKPPFMRSFVVPYAELEQAMATMSALMEKGVVPLAIEFLEVELIAITEKYLGLAWPTRLGRTQLLIIADAYSEEELDRLSELIGDICLENGGLDVFVADTLKKQEEVLTIRSRIYDAIKSGTIEILDISLPRGEVAAHVRKVYEVAREYDVWLPTFGHAADGNVHTHLMKVRYEGEEMIPVPEPEWRDKIDLVRQELFRDCADRGGVISGEHGIGLVKKPYLHHSLNTAHVDLMRGIKRVFDPNNIMNPGKIFD